MKNHTRPLLVSGLCGVWIPLVFSVTAASVAVQAGAELHWRPSLFRSFTWALLGSDGMALQQALPWAAWTVSGTAAVSGLALRDLAPRRTGWRRLGLVPMGLLLLMAAFSLYLWRPGVGHDLEPPPGLVVWVVGVVVLAIVAWLRTALRPRKSVKDQ